MRSQSPLSPRTVAESLGVSESSIKRWVDEGTLSAAKTSGGHRKIAIEEVVRFSRDSQMPLARPDLLGLAEVATSGASPTGSEGSRLFAFLVEGEAEAARSQLLSLYLKGWSLARLLDGPIAESFERLGQLWYHDPRGIFLEHRATQIVLGILHRLGTLLPRTQVGAPRAVGAAPSGDPYYLPSFSASLLLQSVGYSTTDLSADTPVSTLAAAAEAADARLVWMSVTGNASSPTLRAELLKLEAQLAVQGKWLILGGRCVADLHLPHGPSLRIACTMAELENLGRERITA